MLFTATPIITVCMVTDNICYLLNNFLHCSAYENVIFCWVMHQQSIIDSILEKLDTQNCEVKCVSLIADEANLRKRLTKDVEKGIRSEDVIERSVARIDYFPTNFVVQDELIYYIDYECNNYMEEWNFENWGIKYWSKTQEFFDYINQH